MGFRFSMKDDRDLFIIDFVTKPGIDIKKRDSKLLVLCISAFFGKMIYSRLSLKHTKSICKV